MARAGATRADLVLELSTRQSPLEERQPMTEASLDQTHDRHLQSWVTSANGHPDFPIQNLPLGIFSVAKGDRRVGIAIGDHILDLRALGAARILTDEAALAVEAANSPTLNAVFALGAGPRRALRAQVSAWLSLGNPDRAAVESLLHSTAACEMHLPAAIGDYTDFYVSIHHAMNIGRQFRPDNPLLPNYKHVPIGYHGRASSIRPSGTPVRRPSGQIKPRDAEGPIFGPTRQLDYELELGIFVGPGNPLGTPVRIGEAASQIAGYCLLNDWSARDIQAWEYQPLGPFLAKNFASTVSSWVVAPEALAPFRIQQAPRPVGDPVPLDYLMDRADQHHGAFDVQLEALLMTQGLRDANMVPRRIAMSNTRYMYWTPAQMVTHHASGGCNLRPGDLLGTGTISGPDSSSCGSLAEATLGGVLPICLASGEERRFLEDGDEVILRARAVRDGFASIGFGECRAVVLGLAR